MGSAIHVRTKVRRGKKVQIVARSLAEGQPVDVFVVPARPSAEHRTVLAMLQSTPAPGLFTDAAEVDRYLREERDQWDR